VPSPSGWPRVAVPTTTASQPVTLALPTIGIDATVIPVGTDSEGVLEVPPEPWVVGWWSDGAAPGSGTGTVVLDAHLDSRDYGTGPFARVTDLAGGDPATIRDNEGRSHRYRVREVMTIERTALPSDDLFRQTGPARVVLVTCGGVYRPEAGGWDSNVVVVLEPR
jgi:sortase (surface protein transpeptidase)